MSDLSAARIAVYLMTRDRRALIPFYRDVLGLALVTDGASSTVFALAGADLHLVGDKDHSPSPHPVLSWEVADIAATARTLAGRGVTFLIYPGFEQGEYGIWTAPGGGTRLNWFADPEGNVLGLSQH